MNLEKNTTFRDLKYGTDLVVQHLDDLVVMAKDEKTGRRTVYRREQLNDNERFEKHD